MTGDQINDLKQFMTTLVSQQTAFHTEELREEIRALDAKLSGAINGVRKDLQGVDQKLDDLTSFVGAALNTSNEETDRQLKEHEVRLTRLETKAA